MRHCAVCAKNTPSNDTCPTECVFINCIFIAWNVDKIALNFLIIYFLKNDMLLLFSSRSDRF